MNRKFYGFEYASGRNTTSGQPNKTTGRFNIAGTLAVFGTAQERDEWVEAGTATCDMRGNCRMSLTRDQARAHHLGMSRADYDEMVEYMIEYENSWAD